MTDVEAQIARETDDTKLADLKTLKTNITAWVSGNATQYSKDKLFENSEEGSPIGLYVGLILTAVMVIGALIMIQKKKADEYAMLEEGGEAEDVYLRYVDSDLCG